MINLGWLAMLVCTCTQIQYNNQIIFVNTSSVDNGGGGGGVLSKALRNLRYTCFVMRLLDSIIMTIA